MKKQELKNEMTEINECESIAEGSYFWSELRTIVEDGAEATSEKE